MYLLENIKKGADSTYIIEDRGKAIEIKTKVFAIVGNRVLLLDAQLFTLFRIKINCFYNGGFATVMSLNIVLFILCH
jgi:hypothetical protein